MDKAKRKFKPLPSLTIVVLWAMIQALGWMVIYLMAVNINVDNSDTIILGFIGLLAGGMTGALQHTLIERGTGVDLYHWIVLSALGLSLGLMAITWIESAWNYSPYLLMLPIFVVPAMLQWWSIRQVTRAGFLWIVANGIASLVFVMFVEILASQGYEILSAVIPAGLQGIASGFVMVWLLRQLPKQDLTLQKQKIG